MRISSRVAVGSPTARLAAIMAATLLLAAMATGAVVAGASLVAGPGAIVVAQDGSGTHETITEAVAAASEGDTVLVRPGTYTESIAIDKDITVRGDGDRSAIVLEFSADGPTHVWAETSGLFAYGILLDDSGAHVENLTVRGPAEGGAFVVDGGAPVIEGIDIVLDGDSWGGSSGLYNSRSAFRIQGGSSPVIRASTWDGYTRIQGGVNTPTFEGNTISNQFIAIGGGGQEPIIRGNTFVEAGIGWQDPGSSGIVEDNDVDGWVGGYAGDDTIIRGNRIREGDLPDPGSGYRGAAIRIAGASAAVVEGNEVTDSPYGIEVTDVGAAPTIRGNTVRGSTSVAIIVMNRAAPTIDGNVLRDNATAIEVDGTSTPVMTGNTLCGNETDLLVPDGSTLTLTGDAICEDTAAAPSG